MKLKILNSNSAGNAYILQSSSGEALLIECGVNVKKIVQALNFNLKCVSGCIVTHSHNDHCKSANDLLIRGIRVYSTGGELKSMGIVDHHNALEVFAGVNTKIGNFLIQAFRTVHDTPEPVGYLIKHDECGVVLFLSDTVYSPNTFRGLNNIIVEANYCEEVLQQRFESGKTERFRRDRTIQSHMSLENCIQLLKANDLSKVNNVLLVHLSNDHSDEEKIKKDVLKATGKKVIIADKGMVLNFDKTPF